MSLIDQAWSFSDHLPLAEAVNMDVTNVFNYLASLEEKDRDNIQLRDLVSVVPPFPTMWIEFGTHTDSSSDLVDMYRRTNSIRYGLLIVTQDLHEECEDDESPQASAHRVVNQLLSRGGGKTNMGNRVEFHRPVRWLCHVYQFTAPNARASSTTLIPYVRGLLFDVDGGLAVNAISGLPVSVAMPFEQKNTAYLQTQDDFMTINRHVFIAPLFAISLMHCKNVQVIDAPDTRPRQQRRFEDRAGIHLAQMYTLQIDPMKKVLSSEGGLETQGLKRALHICRGHFASYSEEKPLFGKISGRFWKPAHVRGTDKAGVVYKDYKVKVEPS